MNFIIEKRTGKKYYIDGTNAPENSKFVNEVTAKLLIKSGHWIDDTQKLEVSKEVAIELINEQKSKLLAEQEEFKKQQEEFKRQQEEFKKLQELQDTQVKRGRKPNIE